MVPAEGVTGRWRGASEEKEGHGFLPMKNWWTKASMKDSQEEVFVFFCLCLSFPGFGLAGRGWAGGGGGGGTHCSGRKSERERERWLMMKD